MPRAELTPFWTTSDQESVRLYHGDVIAVLKRLPEKSVQCVVTSPPYFGLRDYGTASWEGGDEKCAHVPTDEWLHSQTNVNSKLAGNGGSTTQKAGAIRRCTNADGSCRRCGARRIDQQIGSEPTPALFVAKMVEVFRELRRVLRDDGVVWLNLGDSYASRTDGSDGGRDAAIDRLNGETRIKHNSDRPVREERLKVPLKSGNLVGIPWRVALALQDDGWILRSDIPWVKRSPMPESVRNRPAKSLEYVFMLVKKMGYFYDDIAVKRVATPAERTVTGSKTGSYGQAVAAGREPSGNGKPGSVMRTGDRRNFWQADLWFESVDKPHGLTGVGDEIVGIDTTSQGYDGAHFATFSCRLIEPFILAGTSAKGACAKCGTPWKRLVEEKKLSRDRPNEFVKRTGEEGTGNSCANTVAGVESRTVGWEPGCTCGTKEVRPCVVLDPFCGAATTQIVSLQHGRWSWGIDLSAKYLTNNAIPRICGALLSKPATAALAGHKPEALTFEVPDEQDKE